jgi:hypothetical protein
LEGARTAKRGLMSPRHANLSRAARRAQQYQHRINDEASVRCDSHMTRTARTRGARTRRIGSRLQRTHSAPALRQYPERAARGSRHKFTFVEQILHFLLVRQQHLDVVQPLVHSLEKAASIEAREYTHGKSLQRPLACFRTSRRAFLRCRARILKMVCVRSLDAAPRCLRPSLQCMLVNCRSAREASKQRCERAPQHRRWQHRLPMRTHFHVVDLLHPLDCARNRAKC